MHEAVFQLKREFPGDSETLSGLHRRGARARRQAKPADRGDNGRAVCAG
ncbi:MAG: hypothetical protein OEM95_01210 [Gammaproteobacteria bacterium]|nr:hypothetical protein [Gammaproteobacteria bacterium]